MPRILIQAGHVAPREPGHEGQTGAYLEQEFASRMQQHLARRFRSDGRFTVDTCPGDIPEGWTGDVFLSLHCDAAGSSSRGFSIGWPANGRDPGRGPELAARITRRFLAIPHPGGHGTDNYTDGMRGYYGWRRVNAPTKVLIEHAFMTNAAERDWAFGHIAEMGDATYTAVVEHLGLDTRARVRAPWTARVGGQVIGRGSLNHPAFIRRISAALKYRGIRAPWKAVVAGRVIGTGRLWPATTFKRAVARELQAGRTVVINGIVQIRKEES